MIELKRLCATDALWSETERLYIVAFPPEERRSTERMRQLAADGVLRVEAVVKDGVFCGFLTWWDFDDFVYGEHFAVVQECRGTGIGGDVIERFVAMSAGRRVVIEVELPTGDWERRRIEFYRRHGFETADCAYTQPPYEEGRASVPMHIMTYGQSLSAEEFVRVRNRIYAEVYGISSVEEYILRNNRVQKT